jgi:hypothetical protein
VGQNAVVRLAATHAGATPELITANWQIGGEAISSSGNISNRAAFPSWREDMFATAGAVAAERLFLTYTNTSGAAILVDTLIEITAL